MKRSCRFSDHGRDAKVMTMIINFDEDYMAPITELENTVTENTNSKSQVNKKQKLSSLMEETRESALEKPIDSSNIGFKLLQKAGYQVGEGLGKRRVGIQEPIKIENRNMKDVAGIGVAAAAKRKSEEHRAKQEHQQVSRESVQREFTKYLKNTHTTGKLKKDLSKILKVIYELDLKHGKFSHELSEELHEIYESMARGKSNSCDEVDGPEICRYNFKRTIKQSCDTKNVFVLPRPIDLIETRQEISAETLDAYLQHIRHHYNYCYYCGVEYDNYDDLMDHCPGMTEEDH